MSHFLDRLVGASREMPSGLLFSEFVEMLPRAEMILADNVYQYFDRAERYRLEDSDIGRTICATDLPNLAPPFENFFVAGRPVALGEEGGTLFHARPIMQGQHPAFSTMLKHEAIATSRLDLARKGVRWVLYALPFVRNLGTIYPPLVCTILLINEDGSVYWNRQNPETDPNGFLYLIDEDFVPDVSENWRKLDGTLDWINEKRADDYNFTFFAQSLQEDQPRVANLLCKIASTALLPSLLTVCFLHCRNVITIEHDPLTTRQARRQSARRQRKTGQGLIKFRTLEIEPLRRLLAEEGQAQSNGLGVALHLCRGHFKDFRGGDGLFGKHKGLYWWDSQVRGSAAQGRVLKDYKLPMDAVAMPAREEN